MAARRSPAGESVRRVVRQFRAFGAYDRSAAHLDIPAALGATDAELARLNRHLTHRSRAETLRETALAIHAGTTLLR